MATVYGSLYGYDRLTGTPESDSLYGFGGFDTLDGGPGADLLDGGDGVDAASYKQATTGVTADLANPANNTGEAAGDTFVGIEDLQGSDFGDVLRGDEGSNFILGNFGADHVYGGGGNDALYATEYTGFAPTDPSNDTILGAEGNDYLFGGPGADVLEGGDGFDTAGYWSDGAGFVIDMSNPANSTGHAAGDVFVSIEALAGTFSDDTIIGSGASDSLSGGNGDDLLSGGAGDDTLEGGAGADVIDGGDGIDLARYYGGIRLDLGDPLNNAGELLLDTLISIERIVSSGNDTLIGSAGDDSLDGYLGSDLLDGGPGADTLVGGEGDDIYVVDDAGDLCSEQAGEGTDVVLSSITYVLAGAHLENLTLTGNAASNGTGNWKANLIVGNNAANALTGGGLDDTLLGGGAADTLIGSAGADSLVGGGGADTYVVDAFDTVLELMSDAGFDRVNSAGSYVLPENVERLLLTGSMAVNGTGNALDNLICGNVAANTLDGGAGADTAKGAGGDDTYIVDDVGDRVVELADAGNDGVFSSVQFTLKANVENLTLIGSGNVSGFGNGQGNLLIGNDGNNALVGAAGADTLNGGAGNDIVRGGPGHDLLTGGAGVDTFSFQEAPMPGNSDVITDFVGGVDRIRVDDAFYTAIGATGAFAAGDARFASGSFNVAQDAADRIIYNTTTGNLYYDSDGAGGVNAILVTTLQGQPTLVAQDIAVI